MAPKRKRKRKRKATISSKDQSSASASASAPPSNPDPNEVSTSAAAEEMGPDLISSLPDCILTSIISILPLKECARTSVLSSRWRNLWTLSPLNFDSSILSQSLYDGMSWRARIIDAILSRHRGPIHSFRLAHLLFSGDNHRTLDRWTETLAQRGIQSLSLSYILPPPRLRTCQSLHSLELLWCESLELPLPPNLRKLKLREAKITENTLSQISSSCRVLDTLELEAHSYIETIRIRSPSLRDLIVKHLVCDVLYSVSLHLLIEDAPNLEFLKLGDCIMEWITNVKVINAPRLRLLSFASARVGMIQFGESCFQPEVPINFNTRVRSLKTLATRVNLRDTRQIKVLSGLLRYFPCLEALGILSDEKDSLEPADANYWEEEDSFDCVDHHLKSVIIDGFFGNHHDLCFARFLVQHARVLKEMYLFCDFYIEPKWEKTTRRRLQVKNRASSDAQVIFVKV